MAENIKIRFIIQIGGKPVENVQNALNHVLEKLKSEKDKFKIIESEIEKPILDNETTLYTGFIEVLAKFTNTKDIMNFILDYTPTSIEVEDPEEIVINNNDFSNILNDMSNFMLAHQSEIRNLRAHIHNLNNQKK